MNLTKLALLAHERMREQDLENQPAAPVEEHDDESKYPLWVKWLGFVTVIFILSAYWIDCFIRIFNR